ncbi:MAG TPA: prepilin-type N-terminal cleavage/methylation domain-containing protein, partial [Nannocystaceae bacterium]|nr:prepilin-type N-terminal cleavage/methylation domain-containing protein [Nannocystaceae bacterium]
MLARAHHRRPAQAGFTLIELMTVIVILGVLAVVAIGAYAKHVRNAKKTEVVSDLSNLTLREKMWFATNGHYASTTDCEGDTCTYPLMSAILAAKGPVQWVVADEGYTRASEADGPYFRDGGAMHGFDALKFAPEGGDSWCGYAAISGWGSAASTGNDTPPAGELADEVFPAAS